MQLFMIQYVVMQLIIIDLEELMIYMIQQCSA